MSRGDIACDEAVIADRALRRMRGLRGRRSLPAGDGILLQPALAIRTAFMRFPIDAVFIDRNLHVVEIVADLPPWRTASAPRASSVLELAAGEAARRGIGVGHQLAVLEDGAESSCMFPSSPPPVAADVDGAAEDDAGPRSPATRVLLVGSDRRFRALAALLLTRRGCVVAVGERTGDVIETARLGEADVVVLDAGGSLTAAARAAAQIESLDRRVGVVVVGEESREGLLAMPVLAKWGSFDGLYTAIENARPARAEV